MLNNEDVQRLRRRMVSAVAKLSAIMGPMGTADPDTEQADALRSLADDAVRSFAEISDFMSMGQAEAENEAKRARYRSAKDPQGP